MKNISVAMSFVAAIIASILLGLVIYRNKEHKSEIVVQKVQEKKMLSATGLTQISEILTDTDKKSSPPSIIENANTPPAILEQPVNNPVTVAPKNEPIQGPIQVAAPEKLYGPNSSVVYAVGDLLTIPVEDQPYARYISLYNIPKAKRKEYAAVISFMVNSLSTRRKIYIPQFVGASDETLIRLDIRNYEWTTQAWEDLGSKGSGPKAQPEPYFHCLVDEPILEKVKVKKKITEKVPWKDEFGRQYKYQNGTLAYKDVEKEVEVIEEVANKRKIVSKVAPWLDPLGNKTLYDGTRSQYPIFRGDWFIANVSLAPSYYDFLKLGKKGKDFEKLVFADENLAKKARSQDKGVVVTSIVARNNRTLTRSPTFTGGYYWQSHDSLTSVNDRDYVKFILNEKFDATEDIGTLPNGLQAYFLTDGQDNRIDFANTEIAIDNTANDRTVRTGRSCIVCHADGIRPIADEIRSLTRRLQDPRQIQLLITRKEDAYKIEDLFGSDLDEQIIKDQNLYRAAVARTTGLQSETLSRVFNEVYNGYAERLLTLEDVSREVGIEVNAIDAYIKASKDNVVLGLIKIPERSVRRDQWEFSFARFMILIQARRQGLDHADQFPPGPLITLPK